MKGRDFFRGFGLIDIGPLLPLVNEATDGTHTGTGHTACVLPPDSNIITLSVYPNPVIDQLILTHPSVNIPIKANVLSLDGKIVASKTLLPGGAATYINVSTLHAGIYLVATEYDNTLLETWFVKR